MPLFPLGVVLLPQNELPLHIFEDRYKEMIGIVLDEQREFGVVLATDEGIAATGCTAAISKVMKRYPDGRLDIMAFGVRRFMVKSVNQDKDYLRGEVDFFDDDHPAAPEDLRNRAVEMASKLRDNTEEGLDPEEPQLSFHLARRIEDLSFRQRLLQSRSELDRLRNLVEFLPGYIARAELIEQLKDVAPRNGHSHLPLPSQD